jgi:hypothetical protein
MIRLMLPAQCHDAALCLSGCSQGSRELRAAIEGISALPGLKLGIFAEDNADEPPVVREPDED